MYVFCNGPHHCVHICSVVHTHDQNTRFCIIICVVPFPFLFKPNDYIMIEMMKVLFSKIQRL